VTVRGSRTLPPAPGPTEALRLAALRRVATLVAREAPAEDVFGAVAEEVARVLSSEAVAMLRFEPDGTATLVAQSDTPWDPPPLGTSFTLEGENVIAPVLRTGRPARLDDWEHATGSVADAARSLGIRSSVATPIVVEGRLWGTMVTVTSRSEPLPADIETRIGDFTELVATAISSIASREQRARLAAEQAALRRVATLVARNAPPTDVFEAVAEELGRLLDVGSTGLVRFEDDDTVTVVAGWGRLGARVAVGTRLPLSGANVISQIARTGRPARLDYAGGTASGPIGEHARRLNSRAAIGGPVVVAGRLWGAMVAAALEGEALAPDSETRLGQFTELIATAIANTEARAELARLADEQAALRRVATLVAEEAPAPELLAKVAEAAASVLGSGIGTAIFRYDADETATVVGVWGEPPPAGFRVGVRLPVDGNGVIARVSRERRPIRLDDYSAADGAIAAQAHRNRVRSAVGSPIVVQGRVWGAMVVVRHDADLLPAATERRISQFTELVATAIANAQARADVQRLAEEQAALRRVATLVAESAAPTDVFDAVIVEVAELLGAAQVGLMRAESEHEVTIVAHRGQAPGIMRPGMRVSLDGNSTTAQVLRTRRSARLSIYTEGSGSIARIARRSSADVTVGAPITIEGEIWGVITASWSEHDVPPADAEARLTQFAELLATAIANADSRDQLAASRVRVLAAGDHARRRVVRDLHDGAQQRLVHTIITLKLAQRELRTDTERTAALLADALEHAEQGNAELRELAHGILPAVLTRGGLPAGVDALVARLDLPVEVDVTRTRLAPDVEASAYFIVAEALTNVVKHARAATARVTAAIHDGKLSLEVRDDGIGGADPRGQGLLGIGDRVAALGGRLRVESPRGGGTVLAAELPLPG
jgi:signal transduction histidine kinase